jgi:hypothetical protein
MLGTVSCAHAPQRAATDLSSPANSDEFNGPFPSWANLKTDYGAVGDGKADDTAALEKALDDLWGQMSVKKTVLYAPAGTYRITRTVTVLRSPIEPNASLGRMFIGEDPEKAIIRWDGAPGESMILFQPWQASISRITLDGAGKAGIALEHDKFFTCANAYSDMIFKDADFGITAGKWQGITGITVMRCRFYRCPKAGISIQNQHSVNWFIWYSYFEDCDKGVSNEFGDGQFHVYDCVFTRSRSADVSIGHPGCISMRRCVSVGSQRTFLATPTSGSSYLTFDQNTIVASKAEPIVVQGNGHVLLLDNKIAASGRILDGGTSSVVSVGNTYSTPAGQPLTGEKIVSIKDRSENFKAPGAAPHAFAPYVRRHVTEIAPGAPVEDIQKAVDEAAALRGQRPVIHIPLGEYKFTKPLNIPAFSDVQIVGDGPHCSAIGSVVIAAQSRAVLKDLFCCIDDGVAITIVGDPDGSRVIGLDCGNEVMKSTQMGLLFERLKNVNVYLADANFSGHVGLKLVGPGVGTEDRPGGRVMVHSGSASNSEIPYDVSAGGLLLMREMWYESGTANDALPRFAHLTGSGRFTLEGAHITHARRADTPGIFLDNFSGRMTILESCVICNQKGAEFPEIVVGDCKNSTEVLALDTVCEGACVKNESPKARVEMGTSDNEFMLKMLEQTRNVHVPFYDPLPSASAGDVRLYHVNTRAPTGLVVRAFAE